MPLPPRLRRPAVAVPVFATVVAVGLAGCSGGGGAPPSPVLSSGAPRVEPKHAGGLGDILVAGQPVTGSEPSGIPKVPFRRTYTEGELYASVTGYRSMVFGTSGLEKLLKAETDAGKDVATTIDPAAQRAAFEGLRGRTGSAVAVDTRTGEIVAMVSSPSYDPASFAGNSRSDEKAWQRLTSDAGKPMMNRALRGDENPGSAAHVVTAAAALEKGLIASVDTPTDSPLAHTVPGSTTRFTGPSPRCANASLRIALNHACTNVFAGIAADLGADALESTAAAFGFNSTLDTPWRAGESVWPDRPASPAQLALAANGLSDVKATPIQLARVMAVVAGDGTLPAPRLTTTPGDSGPRGGGPRGPLAGVHPSTVSI
ncbi:penicillin-binding transpeptidase domain-containing protein, partial [Streptomyces sp. NPDC058953]|uniref:penicillin-binding transpeptidase domain-containing protein n=1 Tax=Streptomyces sp. NPDC058953 TaxID=3346676 RepID=UPI0036CDE513